MAETERDRLKDWLKELELADKSEKNWRKDSERVISIYRGDESRADATDGGTRLKTNSFNILWANTETIRPALYNSTPQPICRRRFRDESPVGKAGSEVLERALSFSIDAYDFDERMRLAIDDYLLPGRGVVRVKYVPSFETTDELDEDGEKIENLVYEEVECEHVQWEDFRRGPGKTWAQVPWLAYRHKMSRPQLKGKFGDEIGDKIPLNLTTGDKPKEEDQPETTFDRAEIWEIWDKTKRKVYFVSKDYKDGFLKQIDDPLNLVDFFDTPRPIYSIESSNSLVPVPEYHQYETLAKELTKCTSRIMTILDGMRLRGIYDSTMAELKRLFDAGDNEMIPAENLAKIIQQGGIQASIWMLPIVDIANTVNQLYQYRNSLVQAIYEITGISDILRGSSVASETATAQQIKSNFGTLRLQRRQKDIQRYARDLMRIKAEIIGENFSIETLQLMTGLEYPTQEQKQMMMLQAQQMQMVQQEPTPEAMEMMSKPTWEDIKNLISNDMLRQFKIDIETDSTIAEQMAADKGEVAELLTGVVSFMSGIGPHVSSGVVPIEAAKTMLMAAVRRFKLGSEVEDALDKIGEVKKQEGPDPEAQKQQMEMQRMQMEHQNEMQKLQFEAQMMQEKHQFELRKIQAESQRDVIEQQAQAQDKLATGVA